MTAERTEAQIGRQGNQLDAAPMLVDVRSQKEDMSAKQYGLLLNGNGAQKDLPKDIPVMDLTKSGSFVVRLDAKGATHQEIEMPPVDARTGKEVKIDTYIPGKPEKRGETDVYLNKQGDIVGIHRMTPNGKDEFWKREANGQWLQIEDGRTVRQPEISNVTVDKNGDIHYRIDKHKLSVVDKKDGMQQIKSDETGSTVTYKRGDHHPVATTDGKGHGRKFHYDKDGKVDQIDGHLGHWDRRTNSKGETEWVNRDSKAVWKGDFEVHSTGDLIFKGQNGVAWKFTPDGKDMLQPRKS